MKHQGLEFARGRRPQTEMQIVEALLKDILDGALDPGEIQRILALRRVGGGMENDCSELAKAANFDIVKDLLDEGDAADAEELCKNIQASKAKASATSGPNRSRPSTTADGGERHADAAASSSNAGAAAPPKQREPTKTKIPEAEEYAASEYRQFLPQVPGCALCLDTLWHNRWTATYTNKAPPTHRSVSFGATVGRSVHEALMMVLMWAWQAHTEATNEECPHTFE